MHLGADYGLFGELEEELDGTAGGPETVALGSGLRRLPSTRMGALDRPARSARSTSYGDRLVARPEAAAGGASPGSKIDAARLRDPRPRDHRGRPARPDERDGRALEPPGRARHRGGGGLGRRGVRHAEAAALGAREHRAAKSNTGCARLHGLFASLRRDTAATRRLTRWATRSTSSCNGYVAGALAALEMVPSTLETEPYKAPPSIGSRQMSPLDRRQFLGRSAAVLGAGAIGLGVGARGRVRVLDLRSRPPRRRPSASSPTNSPRAAPSTATTRPGS